MPIYVYRCDCGARFDRLLPLAAEAPPCPECGGETRKIPAGSSLGGRASPARPGGSVPPQWRGLREGGPERVARESRFRDNLAAKHAGGQGEAGASGSSQPSSNSE